MRIPVCPRHSDPLDPPMEKKATRDGRDYFACPLCSVEIDRPSRPDPSCADSHAPAAGQYTGQTDVR